MVVEKMEDTIHAYIFPKTAASFFFKSLKNHFNKRDFLLEAHSNIFT